LIADVYNALRANGALWQRTLLVVTYDEHGGF
jgi:phospholipase C